MSIDNLRIEIDELDSMIIDSIKKRLELSKKIIAEKKKKGIQTEDSEREKKIIERLAKESGLRKEYVNNLYNVIFNESKGGK